MSYFAIERNGKCLEHVGLTNENGNSDRFDEYLNMSYDEMILQEDLGDFVLANMEASDAFFESENDQTIITLIGDDDIFIWSIIMGTVDDEIRYITIDWKKDENKYRYESVEA